MLNMGAKLHDHYRDTDSESIICHRFCIALSCWNKKVPTTKGYTKAVTNKRLAIEIVFLFVATTFNSAVLAVAQ